MRAVDFLNLDLMDKVKTLYQEGDFIVGIRYYGYKVNLYLLSNYFVEVFYNHKMDRIDKIDLLDDKHSRFNFYMDQIRLPADIL